MSKRIWIPIGPTACGKTPFIKEYFKDRPHFHIEWKQINKENRSKDKREIYSIVMHRLKLGLIDKRPKFDDIIIDSTNLEFNQRANYYKLIEQYAPGADITILYWPNNLLLCLYWNSKRDPKDRVSDVEICRQNNKPNFPFEIDPSNIMYMQWEPVPAGASIGENLDERSETHVPNDALLPDGVGTLELHSGDACAMGDSITQPVVVFDRLAVNETIKSAAKRIIGTALKRLEQSGIVTRRDVQTSSGEQQTFEIKLPTMKGE